MAAALIAKPSISAAIAEGTKRQLDKVGLTAELTKEAIRRHVEADAKGDIRKLFDAKGNIRPIGELDDAEAMMIGGLDVVIRNVAAGDGHTDTIWRIKLRDQSSYVEMAAKHFALLTDVVKVDIERELLDRLARGRMRVVEMKRKLLEAGQR